MTNNSRPTEPLNLKAKLILAAFGSLLGLGALSIAYYTLRPTTEGVEFENVDDFRNALKDSRGNGKYRRPDGSLPFVAVINPHPSDEIIYTLRPNLKDNFTGVTVTTNSQGMRSPERPIEKPDGVYRIALMGDSFAFGWGVDQEKGFAQVIEDRLNQAFEGHPKVEVLNFGIPGYSTFQEVALFQERALQFKPDAVLVFLVDNDFDFPFFIRDNSKPSGLVQSFSLGRLGQSNNPLLQAQKEAMKGKDPMSSFVKLNSIAKPAGLESFVAINPRKGWREITKKLSPLKDTTLIHLIDIGEPFELIVREKGYTDADMNLPNDPHPTALRHQIYGELMSERMAPIIRQQ
jgi:hypothetical protein